MSESLSSASQPVIERVDDPALNSLCDHLRELGDGSGVEDWPRESLRRCAEAGVYRWFLPIESGGYSWSEVDQTRGYLRLSAADLSTTFIITQYMGAIRRIAGSGNRVAIDRWIEPLVSGSAFGTVGISHLTTSRRHLTKPVLRATEIGTDRFRLQGMAPWVTGAPHADVLVIGATLDDGREILAAVPTRTGDGVDTRIEAGRGIDLVALSASCTDRVKLDGVEVDASSLLAGPIENVMNSGVGARTGGLQTSTLAIGLSRAAVDYLVDEASRRDDLREAAGELSRETDQLEANLLAAASGDMRCNASQIRGQANRLALRTTQAALTAAKGAGFISGHPVGRWCQQSLFFLVWSCPQPVAQAHLCELAGIS